MPYIDRDFEDNGKHTKFLEQIKEQRESIRAMLRRLDFNSFEINEVLKIVDLAQKRIQEISDSLVGTNVNQDPKKPTEKAMKEIDKIIKNMPNEIKKKVFEIINLQRDKKQL